MSETKEEQKNNKLAWLKDLLNNIPLLKWVKLYSADKMLETNELADKMGVTTNKDSVSISDNTLTKVITTNAEFKGKAIVKFSMEQIVSLAKNFSELKTGQLIIVDNDRKDMVVELKERKTIIFVCPLPKSD